MLLNYRVSENENGKYLRDILKNKLFISNILMKKIKNGKCIFVNDIPEFVNYKVKNNDYITVDLSKKDDNLTHFIDKFKPIDMPLDILYEDEYLLVLNKPINMPTHPSCDNYENTLANGVLAYLSKQNIFDIHIVTRLDKNTSGVCIFAKNEYVQELFTRKKDIINISKEYLCIVNGIVKKDHYIIEVPIARKNGSIIVREVNTNGDFAKTEYNIISRNFDKNYSVLNIILHTGRTHQIRVHMSHIGHVILGDELYGFEYGIYDIDKLIKRQALHAFKISFNHPITKKYIEIKANTPNDMSYLI